MGKFEVLGYLTMRRLSGDMEYYRYGEVHEGLKSQDISLSYTSVWRSINSLYSDGLLEVEFEVEGLQRTAKFRARVLPDIQVSYMKRAYNTPCRVEEESGRATLRKALRASQAAPGALAAQEGRVRGGNGRLQ